MLYNLDMNLTERWDPSRNIPQNDVDRLALRIFEGKPVARLELLPSLNPAINNPWQSVEDWAAKVQEFLGVSKEKIQAVRRVETERRYCVMTHYPKYYMILMLGDERFLNWIWLAHWDDGQTTISFDGLIAEREKPKGSEEEERAKTELFKEGLEKLSGQYSDFDCRARLNAAVESDRQRQRLFLEGKLED